LTELVCHGYIASADQRLSVYDSPLARLAGTPQMDSKFNQFTGEAIFQADLGSIREAIRDFAGNWLADWEVNEAPDGIEARGRTHDRPAIAIFRINATPGGARVAVELQVEQAGSTESAPADTVEDYDGLIHKWLDALPWWITQKQNSAAPTADAEHKSFASVPQYRRRVHAGDIVGGIFLVFWFLVITLYGLLALIGLLTGELGLPSKRTGQIGIIKGWKARIISLAMLAIYGWIVAAIWNWRNRHKGSPWF
jgi:hypothetical protein